ncbi:hypothetical protein FEE95_13780 [Maribacter algarum]|uniref:Uncharacterized protein n=1 Tax=Maribacter algarum (ex Zhang et al. 2020) TaxID=2578118 RepID=A0A5S3PS85_9FLAO|nr:hypothetical protein [Maribacter algarum]TMM57544.1 hypothetical protein FEE95_13780 [Maribacter algarum]
MSIILIAIVIGVIAFFALTQINKDGKYADLGINISRVYCPNCNQKQPIMRKPANERQALFGGYTCKKCKTEMDKYGKELKT